MEHLRNNDCPAEELLKILSGKWKAQIFKKAAEKPIRFNQLMRDLPGATRQSLTNSLKELVENGLLDRRVIREKPLHIEYHISQKAKSLIPVFIEIEKLSQSTWSE